MNSSTSRRGIDPSTIVIGILLLLLALAVAWDAAAMRGGIATYGIGPTAMSYVVAGGLGILGAGHLLAALREGVKHREASDAHAIVWILAGLLALIFIVQQAIGFVAGVTILFAATARGFRNDLSLTTSNRLATAALLALALPLAVPMLGFFVPVINGLQAALAFVGWAGLALLLLGLIVPPRSTEGLKDLFIAAVLGIIVYLAFSKLLALSLPQGTLERLF